MSAADYRRGIEDAARKCDGLAALNRAYVENSREPTSEPFKAAYEKRMEWHRDAAQIYADAAKEIRGIPVPDGEPDEPYRGTPFPPSFSYETVADVEFGEFVPSEVPDGERAEVTDDGDIAVRIVRAVAEIPDRYSPPDNPDMMNVTLQELNAIVRDALRTARGQG